MPERKKTSQNKQNEVKQQRRLKQQKPEPLSEGVHDHNERILSMTETPFHARIDEHAALLSKIPFRAQRDNFIQQLHQTYGNRYVQCLLESMNAQAELTVSDPNDIYEQEADRVADEVTRAISSPAQRQTPEEEEELLQGKSLVQRQTPEEEELQTQLDAGQMATASEDLETSINNAKGGGQPLSDVVRKPMEQAFGADFSGVRIHTDPEADTLNQQLSARAFTTGQDVFFREDEYNPGSYSGKRLIAHELTHVVQQRSRGNQLQTKLSEKLVTDAAMAVIRAYSHDLQKIIGNSALLQRVARIRILRLPKEERGVENVDWDRADVDAVIAEVKDYRLGEYTEFYKVIGELAKVTGEPGKKYCDQLKSIKWYPDPNVQWEAPRIVFGPTPSKGFYDSSTRTIQVDLDKHENDLAVLDTILYESINAMRIAECEHAMEEFHEYGTDLVYIDKLKEIYGVGLSQLCIKLGVTQYMTIPDEYTCVKQGFVPMPTTAEVGKQAARQALWFWKTEGFSEDNRKMLYGASPHAPGMKSTEEVYRASEEEELLQGKSLLQRQTPEEELEMKASQVQRQEEDEEFQMQASEVGRSRIINKENQTGMPDYLKTGIENLSGMAMDDVKVHYNSAKPAEVQALAYAQGNDIYVAPGQESHLPHEAWHVVQQKKGEVKSDAQIRGYEVNIDSKLEEEADIMGAKASNLISVESRLPTASQSEQSRQLLGQTLNVAQRNSSGVTVRQFICGFGKKATRELAESAPPEGIKIIEAAATLEERENPRKIGARIVEKLGLEPIGAEEITTYLKSEEDMQVIQKALPTVVYHTTAPITVYHGTLTKNVASILEQGLLPSKGGEGGAGGLLTEPLNAKGYVYITSTPDNARAAAYQFFPGQSITILEVTLDAGTVLVQDPDLASAVRTASIVKNVKRYKASR